MLLALGLASTGPAAAEKLKIYVVDAGVYRVTQEELRGAGMDLSRVDPAAFGLSCAGRPVPLWVEDGGDGSFDPGDALVFVGEHLPGEISYFNEYTPLNVYVLDTQAHEPARFEADAPPEGCDAASVRLLSSRHLEQDLLRVRFPSEEKQRQEVWFWAKITQIDPEPFVVPITLSDLDVASGRQVALRIRARGWSRLPRDVADEANDHRLEVALNGRPVGAFEWDNRDGGYETRLDLPAASLRSGANEISFRVPKRMLGQDDRARVDVVLLNSVDIDYPRTNRIAEPQEEIAGPAARDERCVELTTESTDPVVVFTEGGRRLASRSLSGGLFGGTRHLVELAAAGAGPLFAVRGDGYRRPLALERDKPSDLHSAGHRADYIIIAHPRLLEAVEPLAAFHRRHGLAVEVVDIADVYDEFHDAIVHPRAIRDFLAYARAHWAAPSPRFVLLVGDASWDTRNPMARDANYADWTYQVDHRTVFGKNESTPYSSNSELNYRNLIPTWSHPSRQGQAASDNWFVDLEGDDGRPEMAIGRFPVTEPEEVAAIVAKTIGYATSKDLGPWRRRVLWITNEQEGSRRRSDALAAELEARGFSSRKVYPKKGEPSNEQHRVTLREAFDEGQLLVHFFGHGGRYIWRTGPPDLKKNHDLFTLEDLDLLQPTDRLPIVLSMTCYSAPFDHPNADSIGEKFLRLPGKGAVAVIAAAWRNSPTREMSELLLKELTRPTTVGEAVMRAKRASRHEEFRQQYNLLGDPALSVALPDLPLSMDVVRGTPPTLRGRVEASEFRGRVLVEWLADGGGVIASGESAVPANTFDAVYAGPTERIGEIRAVRIYVWDDQSGRDGMGIASLALPEATAANVVPRESENGQ